jgi:hypothetical protein
MSTKIYRGFRLRTDSLSEAMKIVNAFRPWVQIQAEAVMDAFIENAEAAKKTPEADPFDLWVKLREKLVREKQRRVPAIDTDFSVTLIPANGVMLGIVYTEHTKWYDAWCQQPGVEEYSYWDNADEPESVTEEWAARAQAWSVLNYEPACTQGFSINLVAPDGPLPKQFRVPGR